MKKQINVLRGLFALALCLVMTYGWALAAEKKGSLRVTLTDDDDLPVEGVTMVLLRVGDKDGTLTGDFSGAETQHSLLSDRYNAANAKKLAAYAKEHQLAGEEQTTDKNGDVFYAELPEGIYLVLCKDGQGLTFTPFLVRIPTIINGTALYDVHSEPKAEDIPDNPDEPVTPPVTPPGPDEPGPDEPGPDEPGGEGKLPQTGVDPLPMYLLIAAGILLAILGTIDLWQSRRKRNE